MKSITIQTEQSEFHCHRGVFISNIISFLTVMSRWYLPEGDGGGHVLVTEFRDMTLNVLFCADVLRPLDLVPLADFTYKYHPDYVRSFFNALTLLAGCQKGHQPVKKSRNSNVQTFFERPSEKWSNLE